jgi:hypothetical protein
MQFEQQRRAAQQRREKSARLKPGFASEAAS